MDWAESQTVLAGPTFVHFSEYLILNLLHFCFDISVFKIKNTFDPLLKSKRIPEYGSLPKLMIQAFAKLKFLTFFSLFSKSLSFIFIFLHRSFCLKKPKFEVAEIDVMVVL